MEKGLKHKRILSNILTSVFISVEPWKDYHSVQKGLETNHIVFTSADIILYMVNLKCPISIKHINRGFQYIYFNKYGNSTI